MEEQNQRVIHERAMRMLLWLGIVSMIMAFAGLTSAYVVRKGKGDWLQFDLPQIFYISTAILLLSSVTMNWALSSARQGNFNKVKQALLLTTLLGIGFTFSQFLGWNTLVSSNIFFTGKASNASASFLYILTGLHLAHLFAGIICLLVTFFRASGGKYTSENYFGLKQCAVFWHFLDGLWVYLFLFLYFIH